MSSSLLHFDTVCPSKDGVKNKWSYIYISSTLLYFVDRDNTIVLCEWIPILGGGGNVPSSFRVVACNLSEGSVKISRRIATI